MNTQKKKILLADDERSLRELLRVLFEGAGYEFIEAEDGKNALEQIKKSKPDLIILDVNMPKMNGFQVLEHIKKDSKTRDIPVVMLTTRAEQEDIETGMELNADQYIPKPFDSKKILLTVENIFKVRGLL